MVRRNPSVALLRPVFGGVISYYADAAVHPAAGLPNIERPYRSPLGVAGAAVAGVIALVALAALFVRSDYRPGVFGVAAWFLLAIGYFALFGRHKLILSPEEEFAMTRGAHGHPEREGYGHTQVADIVSQRRATEARDEVAGTGG
jgi:ethanolamine permease